MLRRPHRSRACAFAVATVTAVVLVGVPVGLPAPAGAAPAKVDVVAAFYPLAWAAQQVGGNRVAVRNLTPAGTEPHDLELTPDERDAIDEADVVLVLGEGFQPAVEDAAGSRSHGTVELLPRLKIDGADRDPHVWLDPELMARIVDETAAALTAADPKGASTYAANAARVQQELTALDERFTTGLADCDRRLVVTAHEAFGYLAAAYGLQQQGATGLAPDAEPDPRRLADLTDLVRRKGVTTIFSETLVSPKVAQTLAREAHVKTAVLDPLEGLTSAELRRGDDYVSVMDRNLARLRTALGCR